MKYPYISATMNNFLFYEKDTAALIGDESNHFSHGLKYTIDESMFENNTREYLQNTWGVVESKEHAEFIIELAELHGLGFYDDDDSRMFFTFNEDSMLFFYSAEDALNKSRCKQITIPLPPKDKIEKPDFSSPPKHFDCVCNKCGGKCCIGNCDEWPKVGDEIVTRGGGNGTLMISKPDKDNMVVCNFYGEYALVYFDELQKPKSKQDILLEELQAKLCNNNAVDNYILACDIVQGKIEGLSYTG